jgi:cytochrome P450
MIAAHSPRTTTTIPTLPARSVLGHLRAYRRDRLALLLEVGRRCGDVGAFRVGPRTFILVNAAELVHAVLVEHAAAVEKDPLLRLFGGPLARDGLLLSLNAAHRRQRPLVAPAFQHRRIAVYAGTMARYADELQRDWADGGTVDMDAEMTRLTLRIVGKTLFDADVRGESTAVGVALATVLHEINAALTAVAPLPLTWPLPRNRAYQAAARRLDATVYRIIAERRRDGDDRGDLLSMLLRARDADDGRGMTDRQVHDEAMTLFLAGHDTTAHALSWTWYLLARHPEVCARMRDEADRALAGRLPTMADLPALPYTLRVFKEALRLYPPAFEVGRRVTRPFTLGGYHIPAGANLLYSPYTLHRRPDYYPRPERFDPERFTPEAEATRPRHAFLPFGTGPRNCIGMSFALMEGQLILATLAQKVTFARADDREVDPEPAITLKPGRGITMVVQRCL